MLSRSILCLVALAAVASADYAANVFMDNVLRDMSSAVQNGVDPLRVLPFQVRVRGAGSFNSDVQVNFTQGSLFGLGGLVRASECSYGTFGSDMKMGCYVSLGSVRMMMNADVVGDQMGGNRHSISTSTTVAPNTYALVEVQGRRGYQARLARISITSATMTTNVMQGRLDISSSKLQDFAAQTNQQLSTQLANDLQSPYGGVLSNVISRRAMP